MKMQTKIEGLEDLERLLQRLPDKVGDRVLDNACAAGARIIGKTWRKTAPTKSLKKTAVRSGKRAAKRLGIRKSKVRGLAIVAHQQPGSRLAHLFEFGTAPRRTKAGKFTGRHPRRPYMRRGVDSSRNEVRAKMREIMARGIAREAAKLAR